MDRINLGSEVSTLGQHGLHIHLLTPGRDIVLHIIDQLFVLTDLVLQLGEGTVGVVFLEFGLLARVLLHGLFKFVLDRVLHPMQLPSTVFQLLLPGDHVLSNLAHVVVGLEVRLHGLDVLLVGAQLLGQRGLELVHLLQVVHILDHYPSL